MPELSVQQYSAIVDFISEDLATFKDYCEEGSVDFEETFSTLRKLAGQE